MTKAPIVFLVQRIGPYHHARLQALAGALTAPLVSVEFRPEEKVYAWESHEQPGCYRRVSCTTPTAMARILDDLRPGAVVCVGYSDPEIHRAAAWSMRRAVPLVTCSDSTYDDEPRHWGREALKRVVVTAFDAAVVAGSRADRYLDHLGMPAAARFRPWDVVDNDYFQRGSDAARHEPEIWRRRLGLPPRYFLCVARFVAKKNLFRLIEAYAQYAAEGGNSSWDLVLSGEGPLEPELRRGAAQAGIEGRVRFTGVLRYDDLPACYGLAGAFILPSVSDQWGLVVNEAMASGVPVLVSARCGCAPDLVAEGATGFAFDPGDAGELAGRMAVLAGLSDSQRADMGRRARGRIEDYSPDRFASAMAAALARASAARRRPAGAARSGLFRVLARRSW